FGAAVQPLENLKNAIEIFLVKADSIIGNRQLNPFAVIFDATFARDFYKWGTILFGVFQGIADQILKQLANLDGIAVDMSQRNRFDAAAGPFECIAEIPENFLQLLVQINFQEWPAARRDLGVCEQSLNQ